MRDCAHFLQSDDAEQTLIPRGPTGTQIPRGDRARKEARRPDQLRGQLLGRPEKIGSLPTNNVSAENLIGRPIRQFFHPNKRVIATSLPPEIRDSLNRKRRHKKQILHLFVARVSKPKTTEPAARPTKLDPSPPLNCPPPALKNWSAANLSIR